jgi:adenylate kinase family enzyme
VKRVAIIGSGGAGKSVFARELGRITGLPVIHLDVLFWRPGWMPTPPEEWSAQEAEIVARDRWILDGNYGSTQEARLRRADTVYFLDLPRLVCLAGALRRQWKHRAGGRPDMAPGLQERFDLEFLWWIFTYPEKKRSAVLARLATLPAETTVVRIRSRREATEALAALATSEAAA